MKSDFHYERAVYQETADSITSAVVSQVEDHLGDCQNQRVRRALIAASLVSAIMELDAADIAERLLVARRKEERGR